MRKSSIVLLALGLAACGSKPSEPRVPDVSTAQYMANRASYQPLFQSCAAINGDAKETRLEDQRCVHLRALEKLYQAHLLVKQSGVE